MATKKPNLETPMLKLSLSGYNTDYIFPWEIGVQVLNLMRDAVPVKSDWVDGTTVWARRESDPLKAEAFSPIQQAQVLMSGEPS